MVEQLLKCFLDNTQKIVTTQASESEETQVHCISLMNLCYVFNHRMIKVMKVPLLMVTT